MKKMILTCLCLILIATACVSETGNKTPDIDPSLGEDSFQSGKVDYNPNPNYTPDELEGLVVGHNQFSLELYKILAKQDENLVYSPYSLYQALTMIYAGAGGETANQFEQVLHDPVGNPQVHNLMNALNIALSSRNPNIDMEKQPSLQIANAVWVRKDVELLQSYLDILSENYAAGLRSLDFADSVKAAALINQWAADHTNQKITEIAKPGMFNENVALALTNAVYFKGSWATPFDETLTKDAPFTKLDGSQIAVPTMHSSDEYLGFKNDDYQVVRLAYTGSSIAMDLISPVDGDWEGFIEDLRVESLHAATSNLPWQRLNLSVPKFKIETPDMDMIENMKALGLRDVFGMDADLSGINGKKDLYVSTLVQKAFINVDEAGTEAAAVTIAVIMEKAIMSNEPVEMRFDHPFLFVIRHTETGAILFIGQVMQP